MIIQTVYKCHLVHQQKLFPLNLNDLISENHSARLIDSVVERLEIPDIISQYINNKSNKGKHIRYVAYSQISEL
jgi:transposase